MNLKSKKQIRKSGLEIIALCGCSSNKYDGIVFCRLHGMTKDILNLLILSIQALMNLRAEGEERYLQIVQDGLEIMAKLDIK